MKKLLILSVLLLFVVSATAQDEKPPYMDKQYTIAVQPIYLFNMGLRFDFEKRIKNTPSWLQISPSVYWIPKVSNRNNHWNDGENWNNDEWYLMSDETLTSMGGAGLDLNYKRFFNKKETFYYALGGSYTYYSIKYEGDYWGSYTEDGLEYHYSEHREVKQNINKVGVNTYIGYQFPTPVFLIDLFAGLGYRHSFRGDSAAKAFNNTMLSYGYRGVVFTTGIRLGIKFK